MMETKLVKLYPGDYSHEEQLINDYACFGWVLTQRSEVKRNTDGHISDVCHDLTFQRDFNIKNKDKLEIMFLRYTAKKNEIKKASDGVKLPISRYIIAFIIATAIFCLILFPTVYPSIMDLLWRPGLGLTIFMIFLVFVLACCGGALVGVVPLGIANSIKQRIAEGNVRGRIHREMSAIAREASQYLE